MAQLNAIFASGLCFDHTWHLRSARHCYEPDGYK